MVLVWTHPVCQYPSAALRRSRTGSMATAMHWRRSSPFPVLVVLFRAPVRRGLAHAPSFGACAHGPVAPGSLVPPWPMTGLWRMSRRGGGKRVGPVDWYGDCCDEKPPAELPSQSSTAVALQQVFVSPPKPWPPALRPARGFAQGRKGERD